MEGSLIWKPRLYVQSAAPGIDGPAKGGETCGALRILLIVNPTSGGGRAGRASSNVIALLRKHGVTTEVAESRSTEHVRELSQGTAAAGFQVVGVLGGDGTFHHAVNAALDSHVCFAFFPAGNGNDIARGLGIPLDPIAAVENFLRGHERRVDVGAVRVADGSSHLFLAAGGIGLDALTAQLVHGRFAPLPGAVRYVSAALWALRDFRPFKMEVQLDGGVPFCFGPALFAAVANGPVYGSGVCVAPMARPDDGLLELTLIPQLPFLRILEALPIVLTSGDLRWPEIRREQARRICLRPALEAGRIFFHGDGEVLGEAPAEIEVQPQALRIIA